MNLRKYIVLLLFVGGLLVSCNHENNVQENNLNGSSDAVTEGITAKTVEFVGVEHNEMLDEVYSYIKNNSISENRRVSVSDRMTSLENFLIDKVASNTKYSDKSNNIAISCIKDIFNESNFRSISKTNSLKNYSDSLSKKENEYLESLDKILSNKILNNPKVIEDICNLEKIIENDKSLNTKQLVTLLSATSVAKHSYEYWSKNISKWEKIADKDSFARSTSRKSAAYHATDIVIGDIAGAIAGAAGAWALNLYFGPGTAAYGGVVLAGAVSGSVYVAADKALHWLNDKINGEDEDD